MKGNKRVIAGEFYENVCVILIDWYKKKAPVWCLDGIVGIKLNLFWFLTKEF